MPEAVRLSVLGLALAEHAGAQGSVPADVWDRLVTEGFVRPVRRDPEDPEPDEPAAWFELTDAGCEALARVGGEVRHLAACWSCGEDSPQLDDVALPDCPKCGAYAGDE